MSTQKIVLKTVEEQMSGYVPRYAPLYPLFMGNAIQYPAVVGKNNFNSLEAVGDIRARRVTPKDSELFQFATTSKTKSYKRYFFMNQYVQSGLQEAGDADGVVAQVLDEHQKQFDDLLLLGEGTSASTMVNNGLFWSNDSNYTLKASDEIANAPDTQDEMYSNIMVDIQSSRQVSGRKALIIYGSSALAKLDSLKPDSVKSVRALLEDNLAGEATIMRMPSEVTPASVNGWIVVNLDQVRLHHSGLPRLDDQGYNNEKKYSWHNFILGSAMLEVQAPSAIIRQPVTFEA